MNTATPIEPTTQAVANAVEAADQAAATASVRVRDLEGMADLLDMISLFDGVWQSSNPLMSIEQSRAMAHAGNFLAGAYEGERMVGACVGFFSAPPGVGLHSHIAGVHPDVHGRAVGFALKLYQRAWALRRGLTDITWTFDPLVRRNAYFNLAKLGALPREYLVDFYGHIDDAINAGQGSDRLLVNWGLTARTTEACAAGTRLDPDPAIVDHPDRLIALHETADGDPSVEASAHRDSAPVLLVQTPSDIEDLRKRDPDRAKRWRMAMRAVFGELLAGGSTVAGFTRDGHYVVQRSPAGRTGRPPQEGTFP